MPSFDLVIVGVGGQGTLLSSKILGDAALRMNCEVKVSEVHGMAQRGGSVITHVRVGEKVHAPLVSLGQADYVVAFEALEAARAAEFLKPGGVLIVNTQEIWPMPVIMGNAAYPENCLEPLAATHPVEAMDALQMAIASGSQRAVNLVLLGALSKYLPWNQEVWEAAIAACVPPKTLTVNLAAFKAGAAQ
ncbi:MAG: indolepyruvate oxidoreductase subunit beta [Clostridia bacterium]|nr:indolepyruvate oxidoreductase subunit beta [Clostridia bacterium]